jgi:hypothetical protein
MPLVNRTRATFRSAEFGFFGVTVQTLVHTPRFCGFFCNATALDFRPTFFRDFLIIWFTVGILHLKIKAQSFILQKYFKFVN